MMLMDVLIHIKHFYPVEMIEGEFLLENGTIILPTDIEIDQYILIIEPRSKSTLFLVSARSGQSYNVIPEIEVTDGIVKKVAVLDIPITLVNLSKEIEDWQKKNGSKSYVSESFGGWSGSVATGRNGVQTWQEHFADRLMPFMRLFSDLG